MKTWGIILAVVGMVMSVGLGVYTLRHWHPSKRHVIAGSMATFLLGTAVVFGATMPPHIVTSVTQATFLAAALAFVVLEVRLSRLDRQIADYSVFAFRIVLEESGDGQWVGRVPSLADLTAYGQTSREAKARVQALALRAVADRLEHGEADPDIVSISFAAA